MLTDVIVIGAFVAFAVLGFVRGFTRSVVSLLRISVSVIIAFLLGSPLARILNKIGFSKMLRGWFNTSESNANLISIAIMTILIFIILRIVLNALVNMADKARDNKGTFSKFDRWLGGLFGILRFVFIFSIAAILFRLITLLPIISGLHNTVFDGSKVALWLYNLVTKTILSEALAAATMVVG